jgi:hypothetical protein
MKFCANKINNDKSLVSDNVDGKLRIIAADIAIPIFLIFNLSLLESVCPVELIWNTFRSCDRNFRAISQPNVKNKQSYFAYKKIIFWEKMNFGCLTGSLVSENI